MVISAGLMRKESNEMGKKEIAVYHENPVSAELRIVDVYQINEFP